MTRRLLLFLTLGFGVAGQVFGQPSFSVGYQFDDKVVRPLSDGGKLTFSPIDFQATAMATIAVVNQGTATGTVDAVTVTGAGFQLTSLGFLPASVETGRALAFGILFTPGHPGTFTGTFQINAGGRSISGILSGSTASASLSLLYVDPVTASVQPLQNGSTFAFPKTLLNTTSTIALLATNKGPGTGYLNSVALGTDTPSAFQLLSLPLFPIAIPPNKSVSFGVRFSPDQQQTSSATITADLDGQVVTVHLTGQATGPQFTYTWSDEANTTTATALPAGGALAIADTPVGQTTTVTISVTNTGTADGGFPPVAVTGQGFSLTGLTVISSTLRVNDCQRFGLVFAPTQPGSVAGQLRIGNDTFTISASGIGPRLIYTYANAAGSTAVKDGQIVLFTPTTIGNTGSVDFSVQNTGTGASTLSSISLTAGVTGFVLRSVPKLPMKLDPGSTIAFSLSFAPNTAGASTAVLHIDTSSFTLSGTGIEPTALPAYRLQGPSANPQPAQQPVVGLALASPYPLPLQGTLNLSFISSAFTDDPAIQFASGGRAVKFNIPANSTQALFNGGAATTIPLQTGTTAGDIVLTPTFATDGGYDLTPLSPTTLTLTIPRSAPQLLNASVTSRTATGFALVLSGFVTSRSLTQIDVQITPRQGETLSATKLTVNVGPLAAGWFQSAASSPFGGGFQVTIPFLLGNGGTNEDLVQKLQSLSITATNEVGASGAITVPLL